MSEIRHRELPCENMASEPSQDHGERSLKYSLRTWNHHSKTLTWREVEPWQHDNDYILSGYRPSSSSYAMSLRSIWQIHNQTFNIWSHMLGFTVFLIVAKYQFGMLRNRDGTYFDFLLFGQFYLGIAFCLTSSSAFHTFFDHSEDVAHSFFLCDLAGIIVLTVASFYPGVYYGFYCEPHTAKAYWTMITVFGTGALIICLHPRFRGRAWHRPRTTMLILLGLSGVLPMTHAALQFGIAQARRQMGWDWYVGEAIFYLLGALIYSIKIPERWNPGLFDIWGSSHQIFHVCVVLGIACHLIGAVNAVAYNNSPETKRC
ncbi:ADIPOR-like receptor SPBC12C2.09c [Lachnellula suecica]|uniref:ADIPOR-like receptor SPBC12C2.09c n=1 Tax=Lachnellula suecica TaxID=602035 RepID=A0A8T9C3H9_9HELO|nr:ADIPOR-like receptor SPBC12C2.09c [Lachnellula suecica]